MHHPEPEHDVGAGALAHADDALDLENVQNVDQVLADGDQAPAQGQVVDRAAVMLGIDDRGGLGEAIADGDRQQL